MLFFVLAPFLTKVCKADTVLYSANLAGTNVVPPTLAPATATGTAALSGDMLTVHLDFQGFGSAVVGASINCCSDGDSASASVLTFAGFPAATSGSYEHTFFLPADLSGISEPAFLEGLQSDLAYTQIDSMIYPDGAIRGQLAAVSPTPEPSTLVLLATGAVSAFAWRRRRGFSWKNKVSLRS